MTDTRPLRETLDRFRELVNANSRLGTLLRGWEPVIVLTTAENDATYSLIVEKSKITEIREDAVMGDHCVTLRAPAPMLAKVFSGEKNPARAYLDGELEVFATDRDQIKLDALSLVLWGQ